MVHVRTLDQHVAMENTLKKRLELLKARARRLKGPMPYRRKWDRGRIYADAGKNGVPDPGELNDSMEFFEENVAKIEKIVPGEEVLTPEGKCYLIRTNADEFNRGASLEASKFAKNLSRRSPFLTGLFYDSNRRWVKEAVTGGLGFFDIETAGLSPSTYVFLVGVMKLNGEALEVKQLLARDYSEEAALLHALAKELAAYRVLITYNGISFDMPFIRTRMNVNRIDFNENFKTLDLLRPTRRFYSSVLPNCKLETVRLHITGIERNGDIPGRLIPGVYHDFVRTGDAREIKGVIYHNRMDLLAMVTILNASCRG